MHNLGTGAFYANGITIWLNTTNREYTNDKQPRFYLSICTALKLYNLIGISKDLLIRNFKISVRLQFCIERNVLKLFSVQIWGWVSVFLEGPFIFLEGMGATRLNLFTFLSPPLSSTPTARGPGERCKLPAGSGVWGAPADNAFLVHSRQKESFLTCCERFPAFKATRNFSIFTNN